MKHSGLVIPSAGFCHTSIADQVQEGLAWRAQATLQQAIRQDTMMFRMGAARPAADSSLKYLKGECARESSFPSAMNSESGILAEPAPNGNR